MEVPVQSTLINIINYNKEAFLSISLRVHSYCKGFKVTKIPCLFNNI